VLVQNQKRHCVFFLTRAPYPPVGGDKLKSYHLLKILNHNYNVHLILISEEKVDQEVINFIRQNTYSYKLFLYNKGRFYFNALRGLFSNKPLQVSYYYFENVKRYCDTIFDKDTIVISNLIRTAEYVKDYEGVKLLDIVDSIYLNYLNSKKNVRSILWKIIYSIELPRVKKYEENCIKKFDTTFFVNKYEAMYWASKGNTCWIPNGVSEKVIDYDSSLVEKRKNEIVFFGKMDYQPNIDAVTWFVDHVLDKLSSKIDVIILGYSPVERVKKLSKDNPQVYYTGFVADPYEILSSCALVIAPMQTGGGIQNKILESLALGKIVVSTSLGAKPIVGAENGKHLFIEDDPGAMAALINQIMVDPDEYQHIGEAGKRLIASKYTWEQYEKKLITQINKLSNNAKAKTNSVV
jgi:glycosyltransferase involved in cell wall biosynthesis